MRGVQPVDLEDFLRRAHECGPAGGRLHVHALMLNTAALSRLFAMDSWQQRNPSRAE